MLMDGAHGFSTFQQVLEMQRPSVPFVSVSLLYSSLFIRYISYLQSSSLSQLRSASGWPFKKCGSSALLQHACLWWQRSKSRSKRRLSILLARRCKLIMETYQLVRLAVHCHWVVSFLNLHFFPRRLLPMRFRRRGKETANRWRVRSSACGSPSHWCPKWGGWQGPISAHHGKQPTTSISNTTFLLNRRNPPM